MGRIQGRPTNPRGELGQCQRNARRAGQRIAANFPGTPVDLSGWTRLGPSQRVEVIVRAECDGPVSTFGKRFFDKIAKDYPAAAQRLAAKQAAKRITLHDRYVRCPLAARLAYEALKELRSREILTATTDVELHTSSVSSAFRGSGSYIDHDWATRTEQRSSLVALFKPLGQSRVEVATTARDLPHARELAVEWPDGSALRVALDQGFGFLDARGVRFDFSQTADKQAASLSAAAFAVQASSRYPTRMYVL